MKDVEFFQQIDLMSRDKMNLLNVIINTLTTEKFHSEFTPFCRHFKSSYFEKYPLKIKQSESPNKHRGDEIDEKICRFSFFNCFLIVVVFNSSISSDFSN